MQTVTVRMRKRLHEFVKKMCPRPPPSRDVVRALLDRYADPGGYVTPRALEGVARLAGLGARAGARVCEAAAATGGAADRGEAAAAVADAAGTDPTGLADAEGHEPQGVSEDYPFPMPQTVTAGDLTAAVAAALAVLQNDRFRRRPEVRLLSAEAEVGLAVLVRGGPDRLAEEPDDETLSGLPPQDLRIRARDCLVLHNQRLVHQLVPRYLDQGLDYDDLFQHGALGLMRAARKFDPAQGLQILDVRDMVGPPGDQPGYRGRGRRHPHPGPYARTGAQGGAGGAHPRDTGPTRRSRRRGGVLRHDHAEGRGSPEAEPTHRLPRPGRRP
ncbi:sigma factor [Streptomyces bobili]|uniref:sigma factor n=1 Tax=Streptomyces bobili TaxID=67280 RepID=UPI0037924706